MRFPSVVAAVVLAASLVVATAVADVRAACSAVAPELADQLFDHWARTLGTGDPQALAGLYAADAVIVAPGVAGPLSTAVEIRRHAADMALRYGSARAGERTLRIGCDAILDFGTYRLVTRQRSGQPLDVRFTRIYERRYGHWLITLDHASTDAVSRPAEPYRASSHQVPSTGPDPVGRAALGMGLPQPRPTVAGALFEAPTPARRPSEPMVTRPPPAPVAHRRSKPRWVDGRPLF